MTRSGVLPVWSCLLDYFLCYVLHCCYNYGESGRAHMIKIAVVEDDNGCAQRLCSFLERYGREKNEKLEVVHFSNGAELVRDYRPIWDVLLLDIEMPEMDGMMVARRVREVDGEVVIIFITNMGQYAIRGYEVDALDFLLKPVGYFPFSMKLDKALRYARSRQDTTLILSQEDGLRRVAARDICYVEVSLHRIHVHTLNGVISAPGSLAEIESQLAGEPFVRCNKGYLVNLRHVNLVRGDTVLVAGEDLLISRRKRKEFLQAVTDYYGGGGR